MSAVGRREVVDAVRSSRTEKRKCGRVVRMIGIETNVMVS